MKTSATKRTTPKKNASNKVSKIATPAAEPVRKREWSVTQQIFIDAFSDALISDDTPDEVLDPLIEAVIEQYARKTWGHVFRRETTQYRAHVDRASDELRRKWKLDLQMGARLNRCAPEPEQSTPSDVAASLKQGVRDEVEQEFLYHFLAKASAAELYLMRDLLRGHDSIADNPDKGLSELYLARAFEMVLDSNKTYLAIPDSFKDRVEVYVQALRAVELQEVEP